MYALPSLPLNPIKTPSIGIYCLPPRRRLLPPGIWYPSAVEETRLSHNSPSCHETLHPCGYVLALEGISCINGKLLAYLPRPPVSYVLLLFFLNQRDCELSLMSSQRLVAARKFIVLVVFSSATLRQSHRMKTLPTSAHCFSASRCKQRVSRPPCNGLTLHQPTCQLCKEVPKHQHRI